MTQEARTQDEITAELLKANAEELGALTVQVRINAELIVLLEAKIASLTAQVKALSAGSQAEPEGPAEVD